MGHNDVLLMPHPHGNDRASARKSITRPLLMKLCVDGFARRRKSTKVFRQSLRYLLAPGARPVNLPEMVCGALCSQTPPDVRSRIRQLWDLPLSHFTTSDFTDQPDIRIFLGEPGAIPCY
jgi:hypothetical protein